MAGCTRELRLASWRGGCNFNVHNGEDGDSLRIASHGWGHFAGCDIGRGAAKGRRF